MYLQSLLVKVQFLCLEMAEDCSFAYSPASCLSFVLRTPLKVI